jgi:hypothetical protein
MAVIVSAVPAAARAAPPEFGTLVPGRSLGGVELGMTLAQVETVWGPRHGRCRSCAAPTWYFNRAPFRPEGAGVTLRGGRVSAVFTVWAPRGWHTTRGLYIGEREARVRLAHGATRPRSCGSTVAYVLRADGRARSVVYVVAGKVWGFALLDRGERVCL